MSSPATSKRAEARSHGLLCIASVDAGGRAVAAKELADWARPCTDGAVCCAFGDIDLVAWREVQDPGELVTPVDLTSVLSSRTVAVQAVDPAGAPSWVCSIGDAARPRAHWQIGAIPLPLGGLIALRVHPLVMLSRLDETPRPGVVDEVLRELRAATPPGAADGALRVALLRGHEEHELLLWVRAATLDALEALVSWLRALPVPTALPYDDDLLRRLAPGAFGAGQEIGWHGLPVFEEVDLTVLLPLVWSRSLPAGRRPLLSVRDPQAPEDPPRLAAGPDLEIPVVRRGLTATLLLRHPPSAGATAAALVRAWQEAGRIPPAPPLVSLRGGHLALPIHRQDHDVRARDLVDILQLTLGDPDPDPRPTRGSTTATAPGGRAGIVFETHLHLEDLGVEQAPGDPAAASPGAPARIAAGFREIVDQKRRACVNTTAPARDGLGLLALWNTEAQQAGMPRAFRSRVGHAIRRWADGLLADPERYAVALDVLRALRDACLHHRRHRDPTAPPVPPLVLDGPIGQTRGPLHIDAVLPLVTSLESFLSAEPPTADPGLRPSTTGSCIPCGRRRSVEIIGAAVRIFGSQWGLADHVVMVVDSDDAILQAHPVGTRTLLVRLPRGATEDPLMLTLGPTLAYAWMARTPIRTAVRRNPALQPAIDTLLRATDSRPALPDARIRAVLEATKRALSAMPPSPVGRAISWLILRLPALHLGRRVLRRAREPESTTARRRERLLHGPLVVRTCLDAVLRSGHRVQDAVEAGIMAVLLSAELEPRPPSAPGDWRTRAHQTLRFAHDNPHFFDPDNAIHPIPEAVRAAVPPLVLDMLRALCEDLGVGTDVMAFCLGRLADDLDGERWATAPDAPPPATARVVQAWLQLITQLDAVPKPTPAPHPLHSAFLDYLDTCLPAPETALAAGPWPPSFASATQSTRAPGRGFLVSRSLASAELATRSRRSADGRPPICLLRSGGRLRGLGAPHPWEAAERADRDRLLSALAAHGGRALGDVFVDPERVEA